MSGFQKDGSDDDQLDGIDERSARLAWFSQSRVDDEKEKRAPIASRAAVATRAGGRARQARFDWRLHGSSRSLARELPLSYRVSKRLEWGATMGQRIVGVCLAIGCVVGCGGSPMETPDAMPDAAPDAAPDVPPAPARAPDLRFQWVGAFASYSQGIITDESPTGAIISHGPWVWSPLEMSVPGAPAWFITDFAPQELIEDLDSTVTAGPVSMLADEEAKLLAQCEVITSLDVTSDGYGLVATAPASRVPAYTGTAIDTDRAGLATWAASEGMRGHVVTAVSGNGSSIHALSFARDGDTATYETRIADATSATLESEAKAIAADGYIVTAFGRNGDGPLLLVGTRPAGVTTPRTITTQAMNPDLSSFGAVVAWVFDPMLPGSELVILER